ncbi:ankyrin repeat domain-containing protein 39 [Rhynchophorus ferrugineus]|uniref:Ankyrin repeat domain-containing protein 39 n=1 Tax=Rhynchophorus ferrugineus TaxID=354439 RepID=A0A834HW78_RHYFE|nr:hypothetical protein GWI33_017686 [Rhynchophorus ferrugineus]
MSQKNELCGQNCGCVSNTAVQSLDEMDFEKGIWFAAQSGDYDRVKKLINTKKYEVDQKDSAGYTALHYASRNGHLEICRYLIESGANIDGRTRSGQATALHRACTAGKLDIVDFLLSHNADLNLKDADGRTALDRATVSNRQDICKILQQHLGDYL